MLALRPRFGLLLGTTLAAAAVGASCGGSKGTAIGFGTGASNGNGASGTGAGGNSGTGGGITLSSGSGGGTCAGLDVQPSPLQTINVTAGQMTPTVTYKATVSCGATAVSWGVDKGNIGTIPAGPSQMGVFTPSGTTGGLVTVSASVNKQTVTRQVLVKLTATQNGPNTTPGEVAQIPTTVAQLTAGGGVGGVGGEGLGGAVSDPATISALGSPSGNGSAQGLKFLYPYDKTVWPRGMLAPLVMWDWSIGDADAIQIVLKTTTGSFSYTGTFGRPPILTQTGGKFIRMPIPQDVWDMATNTAGGASDQLTLSLTVAKGGMGYGPISETWTIAPGRLDGTIYYNSYGTLLVQNSGGAVGGNGEFGAAVLSIHVGDTGPKVVAGTAAECRTCHSVAANGSRLVAMPYGNYSDYDITPGGSVEHVMPNSGAWFPGIYPDGSRMLTGDAQLLALPAGGGALPHSGLSTGAPDMPMFSPDGKHVAFNPGIGQQITVQSFDVTTGTFSGAVTAVTSPAGLTPGWPAFFPDSNSLVYESESAAGYDGHSNGLLWTRGGATGQILWAPAAGGTSVPLDQLNGKGYLPKLAAPSTLYCSADGNSVGANASIPDPDLDHGNDADHNYEPTVNPIGSGGYAWVVFTSRRMYGNEATIPPFCSDPRGVDLVKNITTKKLWVAAIDLTQGMSADASHPAFYLPAQELLAGNSRGFWALDPCKADGASCMSGDQCCNGYCEPNGPMGALVCSNMPPMNTCSGIGDKCTTTADCCDPTAVCLNGFCAVSSPQ